MLAPADWVFWPATLAAQAVLLALTTCTPHEWPRLTTLLCSGPLWVFAARVSCVEEAVPGLGDYCWALAYGLGLGAVLLQWLLQNCAHFSSRGLQLAPLLYLCGLRDWTAWAATTLTLELVLAVAWCGCKRKRPGPAEALYAYVSALVLALDSGLLISAGVEALTGFDDWEALSPRSASPRHAGVWAACVTALAALATWCFYSRARQGYASLPNKDGAAVELATG